jgi:hypothetical protein
MTPAERLIDEIMGAARMPSGRRRREVQRELLAHVEDFVSSWRQRGRSEEDIERLLLERFGDPRQVAEQFACVYRRERAVLHFGWFLISTVVVSLIISAAALSMQAGVMLGFGAPVLAFLGTRHAIAEGLDIAATVATYVGLVSLGRFFGYPLAVLAVVTTGLFALFAATGLPTQFILFGFLNGTLLRGIQVAVRHRMLQFGAALGCLGALGIVFFHPSSSAPVVTAASWLMMGTAYHLMTHVASRVDRVLAARL